MQGSENKTDNNNKNKKKSIFFFTWFKRNFYLLFLIFLSFLTISSIIIILLSKTLWFRQKASSIVLSAVNSQLNEGARFHFDDVGLSYLLGFKLYNVSLSFKGDTIINCKEIDAGFKILPLFNKQIIINKLLLTNPKLNIIKNNNGVLNIEQIVEKSHDTNKTNADWIINLNGFELQNASLIYFDSTKSIIKGFDYNHLDIKKMDLAINGQIDLKNSIYKLDFSKLKFYDKKSKFGIKDLNFYIYLDTTKALIEDLNFASYKSKFGLDITIDNINFFNPKFDIYRAFFTINLFADRISPSDINKLGFIPVKLNYDLHTEIDCEGTIDNLQFNLKKLKYNNSQITFKSHIVDITDTTNYKINLNFNNSKIYQKDIYPLIIDFAQSYLPDFEELQINKLNIDFNKNYIEAKLDLKSNLGNISGDLKYNFNHLFYSGNLKSEDLNIANIIKSKSLDSKLNTEIHFQGKGTDLSNLSFHINAKAHNSRITNFSFDNLVFIARTDSIGKIILDSLAININPYKNAYSNNQSNIFIKGSLDFDNPNNPKYLFKSDFKNINLAEIIENKSLPDLISANVNLEGSGFEPDSIIVKLKISISKMQVNSYNIYSKDIVFDIKRKNNHKEINIISDFLNANINGEFNYFSLLKDLSLQNDLIQNYVLNRIESLSGKDSIKQINNSLSTIPEFSNSNFQLSLQLKDNDILKAFLGFNKLKSDLDLKCSVNINDKKSQINLSRLFIKKFRLKSKESDFIINPILLHAKINTSIKDSNLSISSIDIFANSKYSIFLNNNSINKLKIIANYKNNKFDLDFDFNINNEISLKSDGFLKFKNSTLDLQLNKTKVLFKNFIKFTSLEPIKTSFNNNTLLINNFHFKSNIIDDIRLRGKINSERIENLKINFKNFDLKSVKKIDRSKRATLNDLEGMINKINISLNGAFDNLNEKMELSLSGLKINKTRIGDVSANINHKNANISGNIDIISKNDKNNKLFVLNVNKLPLNLSFIAPKNRYDNSKPIDLELHTNNLPLELFAPFTDQISKLKGYSDLNLKIKGNNTKNIDFKGNILIRKANFLLSANNMNYSAYGKINFKTDTITITKFVLENNKKDISHGRINISGKTILNNLELKHYDFKIEGKKFQVLSRASMKPIPSLYGDMILSIGPNPIHIFGNLKEPNIRGDINILRSNLAMPSTNEEIVKKSRLIYKIKQNEINYYIVKDTLTEKISNRKKTTNKEKTESEISNNIDIDLRIFFKGQFVATMDITGIGQLYAEIGTANPDMALRFVLNRGDDQPKLFGTDLIVKEGSTLKFIKILNTSGKISFQKGGLKNPNINFIATYEGQRYLSDEVSDYKVYVHIKGTKEKPIISFSYSINGKEAVGDSSKINENAILLLALGKTKEEMINKNSGNFDIMAPASSFASAAMSTALTDFVQSTGFIQSADIDIGNSLTDLNQAKMKFSGEVKGIRWTLGGTVADFASNNEISIDIPQNINIGVDFINHIILQLTKSTNSTQSAASRNQKDWEIKIKVGGSW